MNREEPVTTVGYASDRFSEAAVRASALGLLIAGGLALYFGFTLIPTAPANIPDAEAQRWFATDTGLFWALKFLGGVFLIAAALAGLARPQALLLSALSEFAFAVLMIVMSIVWTMKARAMGGFNAMVILLLIFAVVSVIYGRRDWLIYRGATGGGGARASGSSDGSP